MPHARTRERKTHIISSPQSQQQSFSFYFENNNFLADMDLGRISLSSKKGCFSNPTGDYFILIALVRAHLSQYVFHASEKLTPLSTNNARETKRERKTARMELLGKSSLERRTASL
jgi:hypothetical protein